jgi:elongation factor Ts
MVSLAAQQVKELRTLTGAGFVDCQNALKEAGGSIEQAKTVLFKKGVLKATDRASKEASEGAIGFYIHSDRKQAAMVELNCETDFVAKNQEFINFANELAMHVVAAKCEYVSKEDIPADKLVKLKALYKEHPSLQGKPEKIQERILEGQLKKHYTEVCLLEQGFVKDPNVKVQQLLTEKIAKFGENIVITSFVRMAVDK